MFEADPAAAAETAYVIVSALRTLADHPLIGRVYADGIRELVISRGRTGYVALYRHMPQRSLIAMLSIRRQRENGYLSGKRSRIGMWR
ncbi:hypothetical protein T31B1_18413 [Salinisphaera sp. T31B1]